MNSPLLTSAGAASFRLAAKALRSRLKQTGISRILVGVSGGADSMLTLRLLTEAGKGIPGFRLGVCHANFHLRGPESMRDERLVELAVESLKRENTCIRLYKKDFDTAGYAASNGISIEMAARDLRHQWWDSIIKDEGYQRIATGHTADDNEETMLLNLLRGSSPHGLRGMRPVGDRIIRPLLCLHKSDILRLLSQASTDAPLLQEFPDGYVTDSSNLSSEYRRNFLRNEVLPLLASRWDGMHSALQTTLMLQAEAADIVDFAVGQAIAAMPDPHIMTWQTLRAFPAPTTLIYHWLRDYGITTETAREAASHIPSDRNGTSPNGSRWALGGGNELLAVRKGLTVRTADRFARHPAFYGGMEGSEEWTEMYMSDASMEDIRKAPADTAYLPYPPDSYEWRSPLSADRMALIPASKGSKPVSDILKEAGIPTSMRKDVSMLCNSRSEKIVWIPGIRRAGADLISIPSADESAGDNRKIYRLKIKPLP